MSTFVLVRDAWHGQTCHAPSMTGHRSRAHLLGAEAGLQTHVDDVTGLIEEQQLDEVILVGHGYAGRVIEGVADRAPEQLSQPVHLDAMIPADGEAAVDIDPPTRRRAEHAAGPHEEWRIAPEQPTADGWFEVTEPDDVRWLQTFLGDESALCFQQRVRVRIPRIFRIPRAHIDCLHCPSPQAARRLLPRRQPNGEPAIVWPLDAVPDCMVSAPQMLFALLLHVTANRS